jgi:hypothetical protein
LGFASQRAYGVFYSEAFASALGATRGNAASPEASLRLGVLGMFLETLDPGTRPDAAKQIAVQVAMVSSAWIRF